MSEGSDSEFLESLAKWHGVRNPASQHDVLRRIVGDWNVTIRFYGGEQVWESKSQAHVALVHGGRFVREEIVGEIVSADEVGEMRLEPFSATRMLGFDNYKNAYVGAFADNQNTHLLSFMGHVVPGEVASEIQLFGLSDEPMLDMHGAAMKYVLTLDSEDRYTWTTYAIAVSDEAKVLDFEYVRR